MKALQTALIISLTSIGLTTSAQVSINTTTADSSAILDIQSTDRGVLIPRMTTAQRNMISSPAMGLLVFDTNSEGFWFFNGSSWEDLSTGGDLASLVDADADTRILVEENPDEDKIRFTTGGTEALVIQKNANGDVELIANVNNNVLMGSPHDSSTGTFNTMIGIEAGFENTSGNANTFIGGQAGTRNTEGSDNVFVGAAAGALNKSGIRNVYVGVGAGFTSTGSHNVFIGRNSGALEADASHRLYIANTNADSSEALIYGEFDNNIVAINGSLRVNDGSQGSGKVLTSDDHGNASWQRNCFYTSTTSVSSYSNNDDWQDVTNAVAVSNWSLGDLVKLEGNLTLRLQSGSGIDAFNVRVKLNYGLCGEVYSNVISFAPSEIGTDHNKATIVPYLDMRVLSSCSAGSLTITLQAQNNGDDPWEVRDRTLVVTKL